MAKTILFEKTKSKVEIVRINYQLNNILNLLSNGEYVITVKKRTSKRSLNQNALMWMWLACIEAETGQDKEDIYGHYCKKFLKREITINGERELVVSGSSKLDTVVMTNFLNKIQADAASEMGIKLPLPSDLAFEEFRNQYEQFI